MTVHQYQLYQYAKVKAIYTQYFIGGDKAMTRELLSEVLNVHLAMNPIIEGNYVGYLVSSHGIPDTPDAMKSDHKKINIHELAFDKCIEWLWKQDFELWSFRANNIFHVRISNKDIKEKRFYSNPDDKYEAVFQACQWVLERKIKNA